MRTPLARSILPALCAVLAAGPARGNAAPAAKGETPVLSIGSRLELFVDDALIGTLTGDITRRLHHPVPREVVLTFDRPWEGPYCGYFTVSQAEGRVRIYYRGWPDLKGRDNTCVAESADGISFTRPNLGIHEWQGSRENNITWMGPGCHNFTPFRDTNPAAPPEHRWKALASAGPNASLVPFVSPDGLRWQMLRKEPVITKGAFDSQNLAFYDNLRGEYVCYFRAFRGGPGTYQGVRDIKVCRSKDFIEWTDPEWLDYGDAPPEHLYTNAAIPYHRAPHLYLAFPCRFVPDRKKVPEHAEMGINDGVLMSSRDGLHWQRWLEGFLRPGPDPLCWTDRNNYIAWGLAQTSESEISLYWTEHYRYPNYRLRRGTLRTDGFVSLRAGAAGGELLTPPLTFSGKRLVVNFASSAAGTLLFELCDEHGKPVEGFDQDACDPVFGDEIARTVTWRGKSDVSALAGRPVRLRARMKDADLYSFGFME